MSNNISAINKKAISDPKLVPLKIGRKTYFLGPKTARKTGQLSIFLFFTISFATKAHRPFPRDQEKPKNIRKTSKIFLKNQSPQRL